MSEVLSGTEAVALYSKPLYSKIPSIRLIRCISPCTLIFHIAEYDLDIDCPKYHALSYTWGPPFPIREDERMPHDVDELDDAGSKIYWARAKHVIYLTDLQGNFWQHLVSQNLLDALRAVTWDPQYDHVLLWVDNICIDQSSIRERNHQVALMSQIYRQAESVIVWLGRDNDDVDGATLFLNDSNVSDASTSHFLQENSRLKGWHKGMDEAIFSLLKFYTRSWFYRRWTWQETTVAKGIAVLAGTVRIPWDRIVRFAESFTRGSWGDQIRDQIGNRAAPTLAMQPRLFVEAIKKDAENYAWNAKLLHGACSFESIMLDVLCTGSSLHQSVRNDRFFACLGVMEAIAALAHARDPPRVDTLGAKGVKEILQNPDYAISEDELFKNVMIACVTRLPELSALSLVRRLQISDNTSWCSDDDLYRQDSAQANKLRMRWHTLYPAQGSVHDRVVNSDGHLKLRGFRIGTVLMYPTPLTIPELTVDRNSEFNFMEELLEFISSRDPNRFQSLSLPTGNQSSMEALARLLVRDNMNSAGSKTIEPIGSSAALEGFCCYIRALCCGAPWREHEYQLQLLLHYFRGLNNHWLNLWHGLDMDEFSSTSTSAQTNLRIWPALKLQIDLVRRTTEHTLEWGRQQISGQADLTERFMLFHLRDHNNRCDEDNASESDDRDDNTVQIPFRPRREPSHARTPTPPSSRRTEIVTTGSRTSGRPAEVCTEPQLSRWFREAARVSRRSLLFATDSGFLATTEDPTGVGKLPFGDVSDLGTSEGGTGSLEVWALNGSRAPFLLRKVDDDQADEDKTGVNNKDRDELEYDNRGLNKETNDRTPRYVLVQECYVQGVMNGELRGRNPLVSFEDLVEERESWQEYFRLNSKSGAFWIKEIYTTMIYLAVVFLSSYIEVITENEISDRISERSSVLTSDRRKYRIRPNSVKGRKRSSQRPSLRRSSPSS